MNLGEFRDIVVGNMPYDTGNMFLNGASFYETEHFLLARYDTERVPYIIYNEEGTIFSVKNKGFISQQTVGALLYGTDSAGMSEKVRRRGSTDMLKQGALDIVQSGGGYNG